MNGRHVFQPIGFDSFGIQTEAYALRLGESPETLTRRNIPHFRRQLESIGVAWNWDATLTTSDPAYYRWTQWIFVKLYRAGLAVQEEADVIWCPRCMTVLAFEQIEGDRCERCGSEVTQRRTKQWYLRITAYADELLDTLDDMDWPEVSKRLQRDWIGRSTGVEVQFPLATRPERVLSAFTTRIDTLFGVTFLAVAPGHPLLNELLTVSPNAAAVIGLQEALKQRAATAGRFSENRGLSSQGVDTGLWALHPITRRRLPIYVVSYVLAETGTGVVMGVPAHDHGDFRFAKDHGIPIVPVVRPVDGGVPEEDAFTGEGVVTNSGEFSGMPSDVARSAIARHLSARGLGSTAKRYRLHDWLVSRQRYWGSPIPIIHCPGCGAVPVPEEQLPVLLPHLDDIRPTATGLSPLASVATFVETACPSCGSPAKRETDVLDTFVESAWYFLRYPSHDRDDVPWSDDRTARLLPVDFYAGGVEHATRHHLYARFMTKALADLGYLQFREPFTKLRLHGLITKDGAKMSKSRGNVVNPDDYLEQVGADNLRAYLLFSGPWEHGGDFSDASLQGIVRFTSRAFRLISGPFEPGNGGVDMKPLDRFIARVEADIRDLRFNTAISVCMEATNWLAHVRPSMSEKEWRRASRCLVLLLAPFFPYLAEELWERLGEPYSVHRQEWPRVDPEALREETVVVAVQVNGRTRDALQARAGSSREELLAMALDRDAVRRHVPRGVNFRAVFVPDKVLNIVPLQQAR
jgi:leucyl-tRNA synthetase